MNLLHKPFELSNHGHLDNHFNIWRKLVYQNKKQKYLGGKNKIYSAR